MGSRKGIPNKKPSKYDTDIVPQLADIKDWIAGGDSVREVCKKLSISPDTWYRYCKEHDTIGTCRYGQVSSTARRRKIAFEALHRI